jgi:hypothetical protein
MPKEAKGSLAKKALLLDSRKVKELQHLLRTETESEAVRMAIEESVTNLRITRSLTRFLDALAREQAQSPQ